MGIFVSSLINFAHKQKMLSGKRKLLVLMLLMEGSRCLLVHRLDASGTMRREYSIRQSAVAVEKEVVTELKEKEEDSLVKAERRSVRVELGDERSYPIYIGSGLLADEGWTEHVKGKSVAVITNDRVDSFGYAETVAGTLARAGKKVNVFVVPDGEEHKSMEMLNEILDWALKMKFDRKCTFVACGGGVIGDLVGFAAAIYQRGVDFVQIPTTLMAMVDSSVGGKTAVNHPKGKNMIGAFYQPNVVLADMDTLASLPDKEFFSGISEVIKYGLIRDAAFFEWQEKHMDALVQREASILAEAVERSCINKAAVVAADEKEAGVRATLNLGHTFGHAIETHAGYGTFLHGEAVAIGTAMAADMSQRLGWIDDQLQSRAISLLARANLPVSLPTDFDATPQTFLELMSLDKKVADGQLRLILLKGPLGNCVFSADFDPAALDATLDSFTSLNSIHPEA